MCWNLFILAFCLFLTGCAFDFSSETPVVGGLSLIDFTDRSGEEYCEKMGKLFTEHFSAEELAKISSIYQDGNYMLLLNEYLENPGPEQTRKLDACPIAFLLMNVFSRPSSSFSTIAQTRFIKSINDLYGPFFSRSFTIT